jgi:hypothetical protein
MPPLSLLGHLHFPARAFLVRIVAMGNPQGDDVFNKILAKIPTFVIHSKYDLLIKFEHALDNNNLIKASRNSKIMAYKW